MLQKPVIGIDFGGTQLRAARIINGHIEKMMSLPVPSAGSYNEVLELLFDTIDGLIGEDVAGIGLGVPGLVDMENRLVFDVINIPAWKEIPLFALLEDRYQVNVAINNDANCFALGEHYFGKGIGHSPMVGLTIGTGLGSGLIINNLLYAGENFGAGEFGMIPYLDECYEFYASGQFFSNVYQVNGKEVFARAQKGEAAALKMYEAMGGHLGNAIKTILFAVDPSLIVLGGSVRHAYPYFKESMWRIINSFAYKRSLTKLQIEVSELENSGLLGAAALLYG